MLLFALDLPPLPPLLCLSFVFANFLVFFVFFFFFFVFVLCAQDNSYATSDEGEIGVCQSRLGQAGRRGKRALLLHCSALQCFAVSEPGWMVSMLSHLVRVGRRREREDEREREKGSRPAW